MRVILRQCFAFLSLCLCRLDLRAGVRDLIACFFSSHGKMMVPSSFIEWYTLYPLLAMLCLSYVQFLYVPASASLALYTSQFIYHVPKPQLVIERRFQVGSVKL